jgi:hypothetical protein
MADVNLIPAARLVRRRGKTRLYVWTAVCVTYILVLAIGSLMLTALGFGEDRSITAQSAAMTERVKQDNQKMLELRRELAQATTALEAARIIYDQPDWSKLLVGLSDQLGQEIVLSRCQLATFTADGKVITQGASKSLPSEPLGVFLAGCHRKLLLNGFGKTQESVSRFVLRLEGVGAFDLVQLVSSCRQSFLRAEAVAFTVECHF